MVARIVDLDQAYLLHDFTVVFGLLVLVVRNEARIEEGGADFVDRHIVDDVSLHFESIVIIQVLISLLCLSIILLLKKLLDTASS